MARGKEITADKLEALGARRLAKLRAELSAADSVVRKAAKLALAAGQSPAKLLAEIDNHIRTIARSKTFIDWDRRKPLVQELENLRTTATGTLAPIDGRAAAERMVDFLNLSYDFRVARLLANKYELLTVLTARRWAMATIPTLKVHIGES
jgi:hypothetical protein